MSTPGRTIAGRWFTQTSGLFCMGRLRKPSTVKPRLPNSCAAICAMITPYGPRDVADRGRTVSFTTPMRNAVRGSARARCAARCRPMRAPAGAGEKTATFSNHFPIPSQDSAPRPRAGMSLPVSRGNSISVPGRPAAALGGAPPGPPPRRPAAACRNPMGPGPGRRLQPALTAMRRRALGGAIARMPPAPTASSSARMPSCGPRSVAGAGGAGRDLPAWRATRAARRRGMRPVPRPRRSARPAPPWAGA